MRSGRALSLNFGFTSSLSIGRLEETAAESIPAMSIRCHRVPASCLIVSRKEVLKLAWQQLPAARRRGASKSSIRDWPLYPSTGETRSSSGSHGGGVIKYLSAAGEPESCVYWRRRHSPPRRRQKRRYLNSGGGEADASCGCVVWRAIYNRSKRSVPANISLLRERAYAPLRAAIFTYNKYKRE